MHHRFALALHSALALALLSVACGSPGAAGGEAARPGDPSASEALGADGVPGEGCTSISPDAEPFLADWKTDQRAALDVAMREGVAILSYTCAGIKVLSDCKLEGDSEYGWTELALKKDSLEIDQSSDLSATLPIAAATIGADIKRGLKLRLAFALIGQKPRPEDDGEIPKDLLKGKPKGACDGATHYVRRALIGAFDFGTATEGSVSGGVKMLGAGAEGHSASAKKIGRSDGELSSCKSGSASAKAPPGCDAIVQLQLGPIVDKPSNKAKGAPAADNNDAAATADKASNPCSKGYVKDAKGLCRTKSSASAYQCDPKNLVECVAQCEKGNGESCHNAAFGQYRKGVHATPQEASEAARGFYEKGCELDYYPSCGQFASLISFGKDADKPRARKLHERACSGAHANSCMALASAMEYPSLADDPKSFTPNPTAAFDYTKKACTLGSSYACSQLAKRYIEGKGVMQNTDQGLRTLASSCAKRNISACLEWARFLVTGDAGASKDVAKGFRIYEDQCNQNVGEGCLRAARLLRKGTQPIKKDVDRARKFLEHACNNTRFGNGGACTELADLYESGQLGKRDVAGALKLYEKACPIDGRGSRDGCYGAGTLYAKGGAGIKRDEKLAAAHFALACTGFDRDKTGVPEKSCRKAATLLKQFDRPDDEIRRPLSTLCYSYKDKKSCQDLKKLAPPRPMGPPPPALPPTAKK